MFSTNIMDVAAGMGHFGDEESEKTFGGVQGNQEADQGIFQRLSLPVAIHVAVSSSDVRDSKGKRFAENCNKVYV